MVNLVLRFDHAAEQVIDYARLVTVVEGHVRLQANLQRTGYGVGADVVLAGRVVGLLVGGPLRRVAVDVAGAEALVVLELVVVAARRDGAHTGAVLRLYLLAHVGDAALEDHFAAERGQHFGQRLQFVVPQFGLDTLLPGSRVKAAPLDAAAGEALGQVGHVYRAPAGARQYQRVVARQRWAR